jgi:hypothetical protein
MSSSLDEACTILNDFENEIAKTKAIWEQIAELHKSKREIESNRRLSSRRRIILLLLFRLILL